MIYVILLWLLFAAPVYAAPGVAVVQSAAPTSNGGTQDFTSSGFGTPVCAMFFVGYGTANGTVVDHAFYSVGFSDFTNNVSIAHASEDAQATTDTGGGSNTSAALLSFLNTAQSTDGTATASTITDGVRLTWADAPPSAYLVTAVMFNSSVVANCVAGDVSTTAGIGNTASLSGLGWQPNMVIAAVSNNNTHARTSVGFAVDSGGITQYAGGQADVDGSASSDVRAGFKNDRVVLSPYNNALDPSFELTSFDTGGWTVTTRDQGTLTKTIRHLTIRLQSGVDAKIIACDSPTSTGAHSCTGSGWTPQAGIFLQSAITTINTYTTTVPAEPFGVSAFTAAQSSTFSIWSDDAAADSNTESVTDSVVARLRRDSADFITASLSSFQSNGVNLNYSVVDSTSRLGAMLLIQSTDTTTIPRRRSILLP